MAFFGLRGLSRHKQGNAHGGSLLFPEPFVLDVQY